MDNRTIEEVRKNETKLIKEIKSLERQLEYLRSGEYYNQLRFENEMLQQVVDTNGVPSEVYDYIDCTHRNTELLKENQELKSKLELYENGVYFSSEVDEKDKQIDALKKKYENAVSDYETTMAEKEQLNSLVNSCQEEIRQLKKQLTTYQILHRDCKVDNLKNISKIEEMENQQKEFIKYLEKEIKRLKENDIYQPLQKMALATHEHTLQKYKEIIGDDK